MHVGRHNRTTPERPTVSQRSTARRDDISPTERPCGNAQTQVVPRARTGIPFAISKRFAASGSAYVQLWAARWHQRVEFA